MSFAPDFNPNNDPLIWLACFAVLIGGIFLYAAFCGCWQAWRKRQRRRRFRLHRRAEHIGKGDSL